MSKRRKARELALQVLYASEISGDSFKEVIRSKPELSNMDPEIKSFALDLVKQVDDHLEELNQIIKAHSENWDFARVAVMDKNILRMSLAEILYFDDIPQKVSIDEAIELAKSYSTENSSKFVNGILDAIAFNKK